MRFVNRMRTIPALALGLALAQAASGTTDYDVTIDPVDFDRWMYPFNGTPGSRNAASTFSAIGSWPTDNLDNKDATMIIAVDTAAAGIPTGQHYRYVTVRIRKRDRFGIHLKRSCGPRPQMFSLTFRPNTRRTSCFLTCPLYLSATKHARC